ncbi:MAG: hypothetical protein AAGJ29_05580 [Pseudomonadota bacterium]
MRSLVIALAAMLSAAAVSAEVPLADLSTRDLLDLIDEEPANGSARLEFAKREFARRRDPSAAFNARQALASGLPAEEAVEARDLLAALQRRRRWIANFDAAIAPETSRSEFFDPDPDNDTAEDAILVTEQSGVGLLGTASIENRLPLGADLRWSTLVFNRTQLFTDGDFNEVFVTVLAGPLLLQEGENLIGLRALAEQRWLGGEEDFFAWGGQLFSQRRLSDRLVAFGRLTVRDVDDSFDSQDGLTYGLDGTLSRFGDEGRFERLFATVFRADLEASTQSFWFASVAAGAFREVGFGLGIFVEPRISWQRFNGLDSEDGIARSDWRFGGRIRTVKRDWRIFGTSPFVSLDVDYLDSNADRFDTIETTVQAGLTRTF